jgi:uncharacterized protein
VRLALLVLALLVAPAVAAPSRAHPLDDAARVVPDADEPQLEAELVELRAAGADLAVIVVNTTGGQSIESYARAKANAWATGTTPAAVFVLAIRDRKSRLEVSDPLRGTFPDARAQSILDNIKGYLRSSDYTGAIHAVIAEVKAGVAGVAPDLESPHPQVADPSDNAFTSPPSTTRPPPPPEPSYTPSYEAPKRPTNWTAIAGAVVIGALFIGGAHLWARSRIAGRATLSANGTITSDRGLFAETLWCMMLIVGGVLYIAAIVLAASASANNNSSSSSWSSFGGGSSSSGGGSSGGGWSGGGASSSW